MFQLWFYPSIKGKKLTDHTVFIDQIIHFLASGLNRVERQVVNNQNSNVRLLLLWHNLTIFLINTGHVNLVRMILVRKYHSSWFAVYYCC